MYIIDDRKDGSRFFQHYVEDAAMEVALEEANKREFGDDKTRYVKLDAPEVELLIQKYFYIDFQT